MFSKITATIIVLFLLSVLRRLRNNREEAEYAQQQNLTKSIKRHQNKAAHSTATSINNLKQQNAFSAVSVRFTPNACAEVKALSKQRFLAKDAPLMPLKQCPRRNICNCFYAHHEDRRSSDERSDFNLTFGIVPNYEEGENKQRRWYDNESVKRAS